MADSGGKGETAASFGGTNTPGEVEVQVVAPCGAVRGDHNLRIEASRNCHRPARGGLPTCGTQSLERRESLQPGCRAVGA